MHVPSMLLDIEKGLPIEVEVVVGEVVRMAKYRNVDVPVSHIPRISKLADANCAKEDRDIICSSPGRPESDTWLL